MKLLDGDGQSLVADGQETHHTLEHSKEEKRQDHVV